MPPKRSWKTPQTDHLKWTSSMRCFTSGGCAFGRPRRLLSQVRNLSNLFLIRGKHYISNVVWVSLGSTLYIYFIFLIPWLQKQKQGYPSKWGYYKVPLGATRHRAATVLRVDWWAAASDVCNELQETMISSKRLSSPYSQNTCVWLPTDHNIAE